MSWKTLRQSASGSLNDHIQLLNDYLMAENHILRNQIDGRVQLTDSERKELAETGAKLGKRALEEIATVAKPDSILAWNPKFANSKMDASDHGTITSATSRRASTGTNGARDCTR